MLPRPAWLAVGVAAAAAATQFIGCVAAAAVVVVAVGVAGACEAAGRRRSAARLAVVAAGAALLVARMALGSGGAAGPAAGPGAATVQLPEDPGTWQARVVATHPAGGGQVATLANVAPPLACAANLPAAPSLVAGDTIVWSGRFRALADSDYDRYLAAQGIFARCEAEEMSLAGHDDSPLGRLEQLRQASGDALQRVLPEPEGGLASAILIGLRDRVDRAVAADFTTAGVSHIVAISGWNIAIVAATVAAFTRRRLSRRGRAGVTLAAIVLYTLFAGGSASVVRAAVMAAAALLTLESGRGARVSVGLAWAAIAMLMAEPATIGDVGFQLSAAATIGLVAWGTPLTERLARAAPRLPATIRECLGISLAAQLATLPIALATFGRLAPIAPAANLVAVPLVPPAMAAGALAYGSGVLALAGAPGWLTGLLAMPAWALLSVLIGIVHVAASIPGANATLPFPANLGGAATATLLMVWVHRRLGSPAAARDRRRHEPMARPGRARSGSAARPRRDGRLALGLCGLIVMSGLIVGGRPDGAVHVIVLDVGQGDAILIQGDRGSRLLIDGGSDGDVLARELDRHVPAWDRELDAIVLTHPHDDHAGGLATAMRRYRVGRVFEPGRPADGPGYRAWLASLAARGLAPARLRTGDSIRLDGCLLRVLWPDDGSVDSAELEPGASDNRKTNDASIVLLGEFGNRRFLLTGDAEDDVDPVLVSRGLPPVDLLKVAHHGSATATSTALLEALRPSVAVISVGADNDYGHPAPATMARLRAVAGQVYRTDRDGTVEVTLAAAGVTVRVAKAAAERSAPGARAFDPAGLLYDSGDVRSEPPRKRLTAPLARPAELAPSPLPGRGGDCRLAGVCGRLAWAPGRSPPGRGCRASPRRRQAGRGRAAGRRTGPRRGLGALAGGTRPRRTGTGDCRPPGHAARRRGVVRGLAGDGVAGGADRLVRGQAGRSAPRVRGGTLRLVGAALPAGGARRPGPWQLVRDDDRRCAAANRPPRSEGLRAGRRPAR